MDLSGGAALKKANPKSVAINTNTYAIPVNSHQYVGASYMTRGGITTRGRGAFRGGIISRASFPDDNTLDITTLQTHASVKPRSILGESRSLPRIEIPRNRFGSYSCPPYVRVPRSKTIVKEKVSYGVACCRFNGDRLQILMVQKRCTYAYTTFVHAQYDIASDAAIMTLLNNMTVDEKIILCSLNYQRIWSHIWLHSTTDTPKYRYLKNIFDAAYTKNNTTRLYDLVSRSADGRRVWEIPKGRRRKQEADIHCAIREFYEETGIIKRQYTIFPNVTRLNVFIDDGIQYTQKYFIAFAHRPIQPRIRFDAQLQIEEISDVKWMGIDEIRFIDTNGRLERLVRPMFNYVKKHVVRL